MSNFVQLQESMDDGEVRQVWVNLDLVLLLTPNGHGRTNVTFDRLGLWVTESADEILAAAGAERADCKSRTLVREDFETVAALVFRLQAQQEADRG